MSKNATVNQTEGHEIHHTDINDDNKTNINRLDQAKKTLSVAKDSITRNASRVGKGVTTFASDATEYAKDNPGKALAIAVGSGLAIGYLVGTATRRNTFWTTVSAAVIGAVADRLR